MKMKALSAALAAAGVLAAGTAGAIELPNWLKLDSKPAAVQTTPTQLASNASAPAAVPMLAASSVPDYRAIVKQESPAVVGVTVAGLHKMTAEEQGLPPGMENDPFFKFFRGMPGFQQRGGPQGQVPFKGLGSGFIISADGLILTNAHVVRGARNVSVKLTDRREFAARVLGADAKTDIAVLKIDAHNLPTVPIGSSQALRAGDWVLAIGSPFGFENTVTAGVVSAKGRSLPDDSSVPFIQSDVAVNPGNSGGPLFNAQGQVVGINSQIYSRSGGFMGVSFSIPIELAMHIEQQIVAHGKVEHAQLGVTIQQVNQDFADSFKLPKPEGALVAQVTKGSAADKAGLKPGDVILSANGQTIVDSGDLPASIALAKPGEKLHMSIWRDGHNDEITATLQGAKSSGDEVAQSGQADGGKLGLALRPLQPQEQREAHVKGGLLIEQAAGAAAAAGVQPGDVLMAINGQPATSVDQVRNVLKKSDKSVALLIQRDGQQLFVPVPLG